MRGPRCRAGREFIALVKDGLPETIALTCGSNTTVGNNAVVAATRGTTRLCGHRASERSTSTSAEQLER